MLQGATGGEADDKFLNVVNEVLAKNKQLPIYNCLSYFTISMLPFMSLSMTRFGKSLIPAL